MHNLYIITIATSAYNKYLTYLIYSLQHFKLHQFNIKLIIISDEYNYKSYLYYPIAHFPYPFNLYLKPLIIQNALSYFNISDNEYMMYVDADTYIRELDNYNTFEKSLLTNKMIFSISPWCNSNNFNFENSLNKDKYKEVYIENIKRTDFIQTSFFGGNIKSFNDFCGKYFELQQIFTKDWVNKRIPPMIDQSIITKIIYGDNDNYIKDYFIVNDYNTYTLDNIKEEIKLPRKYCNDTFDIISYPNIFLIQKFNPEIKSKIRFSI